MSQPSPAAAVAPAHGPALLEPVAPSRAGLALEGIVKRWQRRPVLEGVDFAVEPGTATWLGGANGVGKTTLLRIATGAIMPERGRVSLGGLDPERDRREYCRRIAYLAAGDRNLYARLSVRRHLDLWGCLALLDKTARREAVDSALERFELVELAGRRADRLSLGQRQRVRLAGSFLHRPQMAMLDEPHTSLDSSGLQVLAAACDEMLGRGGSVIWCSPEPDQAKLRFDRGLVLEAGRLRPL
jgi:ABC-type multidrug transport system ATPase subunit